ncbi:hypothetical protein CBW65_13125 [Tumebacillus avium]|uniref:Uncharacterized protein n=1 Tax=Tumebacillus avium TaxID=1903704 RepID=A0A1Y0IN02_9BACL|nr:hypothetical protein [Tumebacillus avium]ARU61867.1 hypothetical protein CBW65_13125 [Tumebacillus avium]
MQIDWYSVLLSVLVTSGIGTFLFQTFIRNKIKNLFDKNLESHRHTLMLITEETKFDFQRRIQDFSLFTSKKHEAYQELYKLILIANGKVLSFSGGFKSELSFEEFSKEDLEKYMTDKKVVSGKMKYLLEMLESNRRKAIKEMKEYILMIDFQKAWHSINEARNLLLINELYLSDEVSKSSKDVLNIIDQLLYYYESRDKEDVKNIQILELQRPGQLDRLKTLMREELAGISKDN